MIIINPERAPFMPLRPRHRSPGSAEKFAVISVTATLTVWTNGRHIWYTRDGQRRTWPVTDIEVAATGLANLARPAEGSLRA